MTGKFTLKLEGDAYTDAVVTADKFIESITSSLSRIQELAEANLDAVDAIAEAIKELQEAKEILDAKEP
tara:strand:- start:1522 stop:1728 length:207 start_codon:yes stop_codon:yes gene_type:complete